MNRTLSNKLDEFFLMSALAISQVISELHGVYRKDTHGGGGGKVERTRILTHQKKIR